MACILYSLLQNRLKESVVYDIIAEAVKIEEEFINDFEWYMHRHRESFTHEQFVRRLEYGHDVLANYYDKYIHTFFTL